MRNTIFPLALIVSFAGVSTTLRADDLGRALAPLPWTALLTDAASGTSVKYRIIDTAAGYALSFRNDGTKTVHFGFWLNGWQSKDAALTNGRIHLQPGQESGPIAVSIKIPGRPAAAHCPIRLLQISLGDAGQGLFWRE